MARLLRGYLNPLRGQSVPTSHQLAGLDSLSIGEPESFQMILAPRHSQSLPVTGTVSLSSIVLRGARNLSCLAEEARGLFLTALRPFMAIFAAFKARLASVWAFTDILTMPLAQTFKAVPCVCTKAHSARSPTDLDFPLFGQA